MADSFNSITIEDDDNEDENYLGDLSLFIPPENLSAPQNSIKEGLALLRFQERVVNNPLWALANWDDGELDPCSWFGVEFFDEKVVILNLKDLCLRGTLALKLGGLVHIKSIDSLGRLAKKVLEPHTQRQKFWVENKGVTPTMVEVLKILEQIKSDKLVKES